MTLSSTSINQISKDFPIYAKYRKSNGKWYWQYEYREGSYWTGHGFDSDKEALEYGIKYVGSQLRGKQRQAQEALTDANSRLRQLNFTS